MSKTTSIEDYLQSRRRDERLRVLERMSHSGEFVPISLAEDLLCLDLSPREQVDIVKVTSSSDNLALEHFLTAQLHVWHQDLAVCAIGEWAVRTDRSLWFRMPALASSRHASQRVRYSLAALTHRCGGKHLLSAFSKMQGLEDFSSAFRSLLLHKFVQWNMHDHRMHQIALHVCETISAIDTADDKALPSALLFLASFAPDELTRLALSSATSEIWRPFVASLVDQVERTDQTLAQLDRWLAKPPKSKVQEKLAQAWPLLPIRHQLTAQQISSAIRLLATDDSEKKPQLAAKKLDWRLFAGCREETLVKALAEMPDENTFLAALDVVDGLLPYPSPAVLTESLISRFRATDNPANFIANMNGHHRAELKIFNENLHDENHLFSRIRRDEKAIITQLSQEQTPTESVYDWQDYDNHFEERSPWAEDVAQMEQRRRFFDISFRGKIGLMPIGTGMWAKLSEAWQKPTVDRLDNLAAVARQAPPLWHLAYIATLGRFKSVDPAALKLLDFIRSNEHDEILAVLRALEGIGSPRALQELISCITRPNMNTTLQMEACLLLQDKDLSGLQEELRSAIGDLQIEAGASDELLEVHETLTSLLIPEDEVKQANSPRLSSVVSSNDLDGTLSGRIPNYAAMSSDVRRALRTAQFFHNQVMQSATSTAIDLSPVIDMQYKALELTFREYFEGPCSQIINDGILQRKLDVIGYARPIPAMMEQFENYVGSLPIINTVPYFSKFKLRKMLRAICQFRPGKRFTLDGLKAFALFFLCFSRKQCRYGLQNLFPLPFPEDQDLHDFVKALHIFQDFRNRAAHEGFQPDAKNNIEGIWLSTAEIIGHVFRIKEFLEESQSRSPSHQRRAS